MSNTSSEISSVCANCGKGEEAGIKLKACTACKLVKYCNRECQIAHRPQHKKECKKRVKELRDEKLFKQPPPEEDCPICMIRLPHPDTGRTYMSCCGKMLCIGCIHAPVYDDQGNLIKEKTCPFCRTKFPSTDKEMIELHNERMELNDANAFYNIGCFYVNGQRGLPQNIAKALELWQRAGELGCADAYASIGYAYHHGDGVEVDKKKAKNYWELAAIGGNIGARHNLGVYEAEEDNMERALNHFMIAANGGYNRSLKEIRSMYKDGHATKDDYAKALRLYQAYLDEIKSNQRDEAAVAFDRKYYDSAI